MKFLPTDKINGFYYIMDENKSKVAIKNKRGELKAKRFKTLEKAIEFAVKMQYISEEKEKNYV